MDSMEMIFSSLVFFVLSLGLSLFLAGCSFEDNSIENVPQSSDSGVVVSGYASDGYIENTNSFSVRVKQVWVFKGETTEWIKEFKPGQKNTQYISSQHAFYIMDMDGVEIGFINPTRLGSGD